MRGGGTIEFGEIGIVAEERLQQRGGRLRQRDLRVQHIELRAGAGAKPRAGETKGFLRLLDRFLLALNRLNISLEIGNGSLNFQFDLPHRIVVGDLRFGQERTLLFYSPDRGAPVENIPGAGAAPEPALPHLGNVGTEGRAGPFVSSIRIDGGEEAANRDAHLLSRVLHVGILLFQKRTSFLGHLDRVLESDDAGLISEFSFAFQGRSPTAPRIEVQAERLGQGKLRDAIGVARSDEHRLLIGERDFRLKNIEARDSPGLEAILLVFQLTFEQAN